MSEPASEISVIALKGMPEFDHGDDLAGTIAATARSSDSDGLHDHDVVVVASKAVSKIEGRVVEINEDDPLAKLALAEEESIRTLRRRGDLVITETTHGFVCANAGVDVSNVARDRAVLLPRDPDRSARKLRDRLAAEFTLDRLGVVVTDTFGRPWRRGVCDLAIGSAGFAPILDLRGTRDSAGRELNVTEVAIADEIAAAADLVMGKASGICAAVVRGLQLAGDGAAADMVRPAREDLFR